MGVAYRFRIRGPSAFVNNRGPPVTLIDPIDDGVITTLPNQDNAK